MLWGGKPAELIKAVEDNRVIILTSEEIVAEISRVLTCPKLKKTYQAEGLCHEDLIETILKIGKFVKVTKKVNVVQEHPADDKFIECASAAGADYIVSGDKHLLKIGCYQKIRILPVSEFLKVLETKKPLI